MASEGELEVALAKTLMKVFSISLGHERTILERQPILEDGARMDIVIS